MPKPSGRLLAIDWLRGLSMVLMALDHVDHACNANHAQGDSAVFGSNGPLSTPDFLLRWFTHLCAPAFVLLAGVSIALSCANARARGEPEGRIDRHFLARGLVIVLLEVTLVSSYWRVAENMPSAMLPIFAQVLWAIGAGIMLMTLLRRLPAIAQLVLAAALLVLCEVVRLQTMAEPWNLPLAVSLLFTGGAWWASASPDSAPPDVLALYPVLAWLPVMLVGHVLGQRIAAGRLSLRALAVAGAGALVVFAILRGMDGFGNMALHRRSHDVLEWLHCSKYPPSITFLAMEIGLALLILAALMRASSLLAMAPRWNPLAVLGRVPMFFYLLHLPMIAALQALGALPAHGTGSAAASVLGTLIVTLVCWPLCLGYGWYKRRFAHAWTRYL